MSACALSFKNVTRWYGQVAGILNISFELGKGITGLLGPNGAGKSTILHLASGLMKPDMGRVEVFGRSPFSNVAIRSKIGLLPEVEAFPRGVTAASFLKTSLYLSGIPRRQCKKRCDEILDLVGLTPHKNRRPAVFSQGMKQRLKLGQALGHDPDLLLLDEPLTGLDPVARREVIDLLHRLGDAGKSILVSSHVLHEVEAMTSYVVLIFQGRILATGEVHEIRSHINDQPVLVWVGGRDVRHIASTVLTWPMVSGVRVKTGGLEIETSDPDSFFGSLNHVAACGDASIEEIKILDENLEALFDYLVG